MIIGFPHEPPASGGPGSFQVVLSDELRRLGHEVIVAGTNVVPDVVLVVGGTRKLAWLARCRSAGVPIIHRLNGINWRQHVESVGLRKTVVSDFRNYVLLVIRNNLADRVVYQSKFARDWWRRKFGAAPCDEVVILNGTDTGRFCPLPGIDGARASTLLVVEGNVETDSASMSCLTELARRLVAGRVISELFICGGVHERERLRLESLAGVRCLGRVDRRAMPGVYQMAGVFLSLEINAACPNAVVEALSSGLPVAGFRTGALGELVTEECGVLCGYGGDPWRLSTPDVGGLEVAVRDVFLRRAALAAGARRRAEEVFGVERMAADYVALFESAIRR